MNSEIKGEEEVGKYLQGIRGGVSKWREKAAQLSYRALENLEKLIIAVITLSSAILGYSASNLLRSSLGLSPLFLLIGLGFLIFALLGGVSILFFQYSKDYNFLDSQCQKMDELMFPQTESIEKRIDEARGDSGKISEALKELGEMLIEKTKEIKAPREIEFRKRNKIAYWLIYLSFLCGSISLLASFYPILCAEKTVCPKTGTRYASNVLS